MAKVSIIAALAVAHLNDAFLSAVKAEDTETEPKSDTSLVGVYLAVGAAILPTFVLVYKWWSERSIQMLKHKETHEYYVQRYAELQEKKKHPAKNLEDVDPESEPGTARGLITGDDIAKEQQKLNETNMWPQGTPIDQEENFWSIMIVLVSLMFTQLGFTMTQNFVARCGRLMLTDVSSIGFYSQACVYLSFAMSVLLFGPCISRIFNFMPRIIFFLGAGFRTFWVSCLIPAAMRHNELTNVKLANGDPQTKEDITTWYLLESNIDVLLIFSAIFTGLFYGATFLSFIQYLEQATTEKNRDRLNKFVFIMFNVAIISANIIGAAITNEVLTQYISLFQTVSWLGVVGAVIAIAAPRISAEEKVREIPKMMDYSAGDLWELFVSTNMQVLNFTLVLSYAMIYSFWSNMYIIFVTEKMDHLGWSEEKVSSCGFWCMMVAAFGTLIGNTYHGMKFENEKRWILIKHAVLFVIYIISVFLLNEHDEFDAFSFIVAFIMGLYDGFLANYIWCILTTQFEDKFLAVALSSCFFMLCLFVITMTNSVMESKISFRIFFIAQTVFQLIDYVFFGYAFTFKEMKPALQQTEIAVNNTVRRASMRLSGRDFGIKELTEDDPRYKKEDVVTGGKRKSDTKKASKSYNEMPVLNINGSVSSDKQSSYDDNGKKHTAHAEEDSADMGDVNEQESNNTVSTNAQKRKLQDSMAQEIQLVDFPSQVIGIKKGYREDKGQSKEPSVKSAVKGDVSVGGMTSMVYVSKTAKKIGLDGEQQKIDFGLESGVSMNYSIFKQGNYNKSRRSLLAQRPVGERRQQELAPVQEKINVEEKTLVVMFDNNEQQSLQKHTDGVFTESSLRFTHKDSILLNPQDFDIIIIDLFGVADEDVEANLDLYRHYGKGSHPVVWLIQEEDTDMTRWIKLLNSHSHLIEVKDETDVEVADIKQAIEYRQNMIKKSVVETNDDDFESAKGGVSAVVEVQQVEQPEVSQEQAVEAQEKAEEVVEQMTKRVLEIDVEASNEVFNPKPDEVIVEVEEVKVDAPVKVEEPAQKVSIAAASPTKVLAVPSPAFNSNPISFGVGISPRNQPTDDLTGARPSAAINADDIGNLKDDDY